MTKQTKDVQTVIDELATKGVEALDAMANFTQEQVDHIVHQAAIAALDKHMYLAKLAVDETGRGIYEDKAIKNMYASEYIWNSIKYDKTVGVIAEDKEQGLVSIAEPVGVICGVTPTTNPTSTTIFKALIALKTRNSIIFGPHPRGINVCKVVVDLFRKELAKLGLPEDLVLCLEEVSLEDSNKLMSMVDEIVATGGPGMVKAAYSSGKPSLGVGQGNVQCIVDRDVDIAEACGKIIAGRRFDNGLICLGEQTAFVPEEKFDEFIAEFRKQGGYYAEGKEATDKLREGIFPGGGPINRDVVGLSAVAIAEKLGIEVPEGTKVLGATATVVGKGDDLCREKLCPVINIMPYGTFEEGVADMVKNLEFEGKGHSVAIHSNNPEHVEYCGIHCSVSRCIVNQPAGTTGGGSPTNGYPPTTTLGCGSWGNNSFSGNFNYEHLMNITRVGYPYEESYLPDPAKAWD